MKKSRVSLAVSGASAFIDLVIFALLVWAASNTKDSYHHAVQETDATVVICSIDPFWGPINVYQKAGANVPCGALGFSAKYFSGAFWSASPTEFDLDTLTTQRDFFFMYFCVLWALQGIVSLVEKIRVHMTPEEPEDQDEGGAYKDAVDPVKQLFNGADAALEQASLGILMVNTYVLEIRDDFLSQPFLPSWMIVANTVFTLCCIGAPMGYAAFSKSEGKKETCVAHAVLMKVAQLFLFELPALGILLNGLRFYNEVSEPSANWAFMADGSAAGRMDFSRIAGRTCFAGILVKYALELALQMYIRCSIQEAERLKDSVSPEPEPDMKA